VPPIYALGSTKQEPNHNPAKEENCSIVWGDGVQASSRPPRGRTTTPTCGSAARGGASTVFHLFLKENRGCASGIGLGHQREGDVQELRLPPNPQTAIFLFFFCFVDIGLLAGVRTPHKNQSQNICLNPNSHNGWATERRVRSRGTFICEGSVEAFTTRGMSQLTSDWNFPLTVRNAHMSKTSKGY